ncbi:MAG: energy-coupling factor ABC transporter permease [Roseinatronobacter sp.]
MHIEPGVVDGAKMILSYATAAAALTGGVKLVLDDLKTHNALSFALRSVIAVIATFIFFEVLPTAPVGVSEVHLIMGTTLLLIMGAGPAAVGLASGLLVQGLFFAPSDLPMYTVNVTTLLMPLLGLSLLMGRIVPAGTAYVDLGYAQVLKMSLTYQGGIVLWVAFWATYGQGIGAENMGQIATFAVAYMTVVLLEPLLDLAVLAGAKALRRYKDSGLFVNRLHHAA